MAKQIKLTDSVAAMLEKRAREDNLSLAGEVNKLLTSDNNQSLTNSVVDKLDYLESYMDKRFSYLESLFTNNLVDMVAAKPKKKDPINLDWPDVQYLMFELLEEDAPEWTCKEASRGAHESSELEALTWLADDTFIYTTNGTRTNWLTITPRVESYLGGKYDI